MKLGVAAGARLAERSTTDCEKRKLIIHVVAQTLNLDCENKEYIARKDLFTFQACRSLKFECELVVRDRLEESILMHEMMILNVTTIKSLMYNTIVTY